MYSMNYKEGLIYKIICKTDDTFCYIGSTFNILSQRWREHKCKYNKWIKNKKKEKCSIYPYFEKLGIENFKMVEIKKYKVCAENTYDKTHLKVYETLHYLKHKNSVNEIIPFDPLCNKKKNKQEYYKKNKKEILQKLKNKYEKNKDKIQEERKIKIECECGGKYTKTHKARHLKTKKHQNYINNNN